MKEMILDAFKAWGFEMEELKGIGYGFQYEGRHFLYMYNENDENFFNISLLRKLDLENESDIMLYQLMDDINCNLKYVKAYKRNDSMWLSYERELFGGEDLKQIISCMILHLVAGDMLLYEVMEVSEENSASDDTNSDTDAEKQGGCKQNIKRQED